MKLIDKVRSPFLYIVTLLCIFSCNNKNDKSLFLYSSTKNIDDAIEEQRLAHVFDSLNIYDSAFNHYSKARILYASEKDSLRTAYPMLRMAQIQYSKGDYSGSEATSTEALPYILASQDTTFKREFYNLLGMSHRKLYNYDKAMKYYLKAKAITIDSISKCIILNNIANIYVDKRDYKKGLNIYTKLEKSDTVIASPKRMAMVFHNIGDVYRLEKKTIAVDYFKKAIFIRSKIKDLNGLMSSYNKMAEYYQNVDNDLSKQFANKAYEIADKLKVPEEKLEALKIMISIYSGNISKKYALDYVILKDSVDKIKQMTKNEFAMSKYDSKYNLERLEKEKIESEKKTFRIRIIIGISLLIIIILILISRINKLKHKKEKIQEVYVTETRISKKIHDELANDVFNTMNFVENQDFSNPEQHQKLIHSLDHIYNKTRDISRENNNIDTGENFDKALKEMLSDYNTPQVSIIIINYDAINWKSVTDHKKIALYRVLQEIMVNMKKHSNASSVVIRFDIIGKKIIIQYTDNGVGIDKNHINYKNGLQNAENRILTISGNISFGTVNDKGLKITITIPS